MFLDAAVLEQSPALAVPSGLKVRYDVRALGPGESDVAASRVSRSDARLLSILMKHSHDDCLVNCSRISRLAFSGGR